MFINLSRACVLVYILALESIICRICPLVYILALESTICRICQWSFFLISEENITEAPRGADPLQNELEAKIEKRACLQDEQFTMSSKTLTSKHKSTHY